jgi:hypothetical protein
MIRGYDFGSPDAIGGSASMVKSLNCGPGDLAPVSATYMLCDDLGNPTGLKAEFAKGEPLAYAPRGFIWSCSTSRTEETTETKGR